MSINQFWWYAANRDLAAKIGRVHDEGVAAAFALALGPVLVLAVLEPPHDRPGQAPGTRERGGNQQILISWEK